MSPTSTYIRGEFHRQAKVLERAIKEAYDHKVFGPQGVFGSGYSSTSSSISTTCVFAAADWASAPPA